MKNSLARLIWLYVRSPLWWMGLILSVFGAPMILAAVLISRSEAAFREHAVLTVASISGKDRESRELRKNGETVHILIYRFQDSTGTLYEGRTGASHDDWRRAKDGDPLSIAYDRTNPQNSRRAEQIPATVDWGLLFLGGLGTLFCLVGTPLAVYSLIAAVQRARLVRAGRATLGVVGELVEDDSPVRFKGAYRLTYHFDDEAGASWEGRGPAQTWSLAARWDPGETILVLYDPANPRRNEADIWEVRADDWARLEEGQASAN